MMRKKLIFWENAVETLGYFSNEMAEYLSISQMKKLQEVLLKNMKEQEENISETSNYEVTIVPSTSVSGAICIKLGANYLGNTNTKNNCQLFTEEAATTAFTPTVGDNDVFTLTIEANDSYNTLQYNAGSPRFAVYKATQKNVVIYKKNK